MGDTRVNESLQRGIESAKTGNKLLARLHLLQAVELAPHDPNCWLWLAWVAESPASAMHSLKRILDDDPDHELALAGMRWASALANFEFDEDSAALAVSPADAKQDALTEQPAAAIADEEDDQKVVAEDTTGSADEQQTALGETEPRETAEARFEDEAAKAEPAADSPKEESAPEESAQDLDGSGSEVNEIAFEADEQATAQAEIDEAASVELEADAEIEDLSLSSEPEIAKGAESFEQDDIAESATFDEPETGQTPADEQAGTPWLLEDNADPEWAAADESGAAFEEPAEEAKVAETNNDEFAITETAEEPAVEADEDALEDAAAEEPAEVNVVDDDGAAQPVLIAKNDMETVEFEMPEQQPQMEDELPDEAVPAVAAPEAAGDGVSVLVVDDSPTVRKLVTMTLEKQGFTVESAPDGVVALKTIAEVKPRLILLDITMPRLGGYQLCKLIKKHDSTKHIPVIMLSGKDGMFDKVRGKFVGCDDYITKPFDPDLLVEKVTTQLSEHYGVAAT